jgi:hypothetical protein
MAERVNPQLAVKTAQVLSINQLLELAAAEQQRYQLLALDNGKGDAGGYPVNPDGSRNDVASSGYFYVIPYNSTDRNTAVKVPVGVYYARYVRAAAIMYAESGGDPTAVCYNVDGPDGKPTCSKTGPAGPRGVDRGLWQWNSVAWPDISDMQAFSAESSTRIAYQVSAGFTSWQPWAKSRGMLPPGVDAQGNPTPLQIALDAERARTGDAIPENLFGVPVPSFGSILDAVTAAVRILQAAARWIAEPGNWLRIGEVVGGLLLLAIGGQMLSNDLGITAAAAKAVASVA